MTDNDQPLEDESNRPFAQKMLGRMVGSVVSPVVDNVDVDEVVERIDVNHLVERIELDALMERIDVNRLVERIDLDALMERIDMNRLVERIDLDALVSRVGMNDLLDRVDVDRLLGRIDVDSLIDRVEPDHLIERVDVNAVINRVDVNAVMERVDVNAVMERVDVDAVINRVDVDAVVERVDVNAVIDRVDTDRLMARIDVNAIVERTELGDIIARSTTGVFTQLLDVARTQFMVLDQVVQAVPARVLRGRARETPHLPSGPSPIDDLQKMSPSQRAVALQRHAAGSVSRFLAFLVDQFTAGMLWAGGLLLTTTALRVVVGVDLDTEEASFPTAAAYALWLYVYLAGSLAVTGRTIGKVVLGLLVVQADGRRLTGWAPFIRTAVFPISFLVFGIGLLLGLLRHDRRELHDLAAGTAVIYAWDAKTAQRRAESAA